MTKKTILTGITPSGSLHFGNYIGAIKPSLQMAKNSEDNCFIFIADYHSLIKLWDPKLRQQFIYESAATWFALGLDHEKTLFYRQSDIPEILELNWILSTISSKGLLNRAHAYKSAVDKNIEKKDVDQDFNITNGLFNYPVLMSADILLFKANSIPVGKDQIQHVEIARDIAKRFNHVYKNNFLVLPEAIINKETQIISGLDGRKMSKSYDNTIPIFCDEKKLRKFIMKINTNSQLPSEPKSTQDCTIFNLYKNFASENEIEIMAQKYKNGIGWGDAKQVLFEKINESIAPFREKYLRFMSDTNKINDILNDGAKKARVIAKQNLKEIKKIIGI